MRTLLLFIFLFTFTKVYTQPNCEAFRYYGDELKYKACKVAEKRNGHYQFSRKYQEALDKSLEIDSTFAFAYKAKSTAYLKSGDFITWKKLIDQAVQYDPNGELFYRASCRYQFFRDYSGAIKDIELLDSLVDYDIGYSQNGDYHLHIVRALSYKGLGMPLKAIEIMEKQINDSRHILGLYDYLHLGVLHLELGNYSKAIESFKKQEEENDIAENRYYIAKAYRKVKNLKASNENLTLAKKKYENGIKMFDTYVEKMDQIYLVDIESELKKTMDK